MGGRGCAPPEDVNLGVFGARAAGGSSSPQAPLIEPSGSKTDGRLLTHENKAACSGNLSPRGARSPVLSTMSRKNTFRAEEPNIDAELQAFRSGSSSSSPSTGRRMSVEEAGDLAGFHAQLPPAASLNTNRPTNVNNK